MDTRINGYRIQSQELMDTRIPKVLANQMEDKPENLSLCYSIFLLHFLEMCLCSMGAGMARVTIFRWKKVSGPAGGIWASRLRADRPDIRKLGCK